MIDRGNANSGVCVSTWGIMSTGNGTIHRPGITAEQDVESDASKLFFLAGRVTTCTKRQTQQHLCFQHQQFVEHPKPGIVVRIQERYQCRNSRSLKGSRAATSHGHKVRRCWYPIMYVAGHASGNRQDVLHSRALQGVICDAVFGAVLTYSTMYTRTSSKHGVCSSDQLIK